MIVKNSDQKFLSIDGEIIAWVSDRNEATIFQSRTEAEIEAMMRTAYYINQLSFLQV